MVFKAPGKNTFLIDFENSWYKSRMVERRSWIVEGNLFSVLEFDGGTPPMELPFHMATFWMRMFNPPLTCIGRVAGERLGSHVREVEEMETNDEGIGWGESLRVQVKINIYKLLLRGQMLKVRDKTHWVAFQYEKVPRFCFSCGAICHGESSCPRWSMQKKPGEEQKLEYGPWLRVSPHWKQKRTWNDRWSKNSRSNMDGGFHGF